MELIVILILGAPIVLAVWLIVRAVSAKNRIADLTQRVDDLQSQILRLSRMMAPTATKPAESSAETFTQATPTPPKPG